MSVEYFYENDLNMLYNAAVNNNPDGGEHHTKMLESYNNLVAYISHIEHWKSTALQLAKNYGVRIHSLEQHIAELESVNEDQALTISQTDYAYTIDKEMMEMMEKRIAELETYIDDFDEDFERLKDEVKESNGLLRSAFMIAKRDGKETNWEAWRKQLEIALERQHAMMYGDIAQQALKEVTNSETDYREHLRNMPESEYKRLHENRWENEENEVTK